MASPAGAASLAEATECLRLLVEHESPSGDAGRLNLLAGVLEQLLAGAGAAVRREPGPAGDHLVATFGAGPGSLAPGEPRTLVLAHHDTVWPAGRLAEAPFTVTGGRATGPGVFDMKAGLVTLVLALRSLHSGRIGLARPVVVVITADEEVGSPDGRRVVTSESAGATVAFGLEPPLAGGTLKVGRRGVGRVRVAVTGREAHAGLDAQRGVSAIDELVDQLCWLRGEFAAIEGATLNAGSVRGGGRANVVAAAAEAELGLRFASPEAERLALARLERLPQRVVREGATVRATLLTHRPVWDPAGSRELARRVVAIAAELGEELDTEVSGGGGDTNFTGAAGIPTVDGLGPRGHGAHAADETVELASIPARAALLARLFAEI